MTPQYTFDSSGNPPGVFIPINEWNDIVDKHSDIDDVSIAEKKLIDERLAFIRNHPEQLIPIDEFIAELDMDDHV